MFSNVLPREFVELTTQYAAGNVVRARELQLSAIDKVRALFVEANPVPVKAVLAKMGIIAHPTVRLPLTPLSARSEEVVNEAFGL